MSESRYRRQELVAGIGRSGQDRISAARVAIVGSGALGCAVADQLARGGLGYLRIIDPDVPELSNLQRQVLIDEEDVALRRPKAEAAAAKLRRANSTIRVEPRVAFLDDCSAGELLEDVQLVLDGTDNFAARYVINRYCVSRGIPWVFAGVLAAGGMCFPVIPGGPCLRCALGEEPLGEDTPTTSQHGILCSTVAAVASLEVVRALKIICGREIAPLLAVSDLWEESFRLVDVARDPDCPVCGG